MQREELLEKAKARGKALLDVGAGPLAIIAARDFDCRVTCVDISAAEVRQAENRVGEMGLAGKLRYEVGDGADLPYPDRSFATATSYCTMHHVPPQRRRDYVAELARVASECVVIADFGTERFNQVHSDGQCTQVDMNAVEEQLQDYGEVHCYTEKAILACIYFKKA